MTDLSLDDECWNPHDGADQYLYDESYTIPIMPKCCLIVNIIAAAFACVFTVIVTIANSHTNIDAIVVLSKLIFCFVAWAVVSFLSASLDYGARILYRIEARNGPSFWKYGDVVDCTAVAMVFASAAVFCWGVWCAFTTLRGVDVRF